MTKSLSFLLLIATTLTGLTVRAQTNWSFRPSRLIVKVTSSFSKDADQKSEGSGLLFKDGDQLMVMTSEHVVLPMKEPAYHTITTSSGLTIEAEFVKTSWEHGLTILALKTPKELHDNFWYDSYPNPDQLMGRGCPEEFRHDSPVIVEKMTSSVPLIAYGFPAGADSQTSVKGFHAMKALLEGRVITKSRVYEADDLPVEFGMSGGAVFREADSQLIGIISHATVGENRRTYLIPAYFAFEWYKGQSPGGENFHRSSKDLQAQYFSSGQREIVTTFNEKVRLEKRKGLFFISSSDIVHSADAFFQGSAGDHIIHRMQDRRMSRGLLSSSATTLAQLVAEMNADRGDVGLQDAPDDTPPSTEDGTLTLVQSFGPQVGQVATYRLTIVTNKQVEVRDSFQNIRGDTVKPVTTFGWRTSHIWGTQLWGEQPVEEETEWDSTHRDQDFHQVPAYASSEAARDRIANCTAKGGTVEVIAVPAGRFKTCRMDGPHSKVWFGPAVVRGVIKSYVEDEFGSITEELSEQRFF